MESEILKLFIKINLFEDLKQNLDYPSSYLMDYFYTLRSKVSVYYKQNKLAKDIDRIYNEMISKINKFEKECLENINKKQLNCLLSLNNEHLPDYLARQEIRQQIKVIQKEIYKFELIKDSDLVDSANRINKLIENETFKLQKQLFLNKTMFILDCYNINNYKNGKDVFKLIIVQDEFLSNDEIDLFIKGFLLKINLLNSKLNRLLSIKALSTQRCFQR